jgi:predicted nuclease of predicted toxin-antitoxin system
VFWVTCGNVSNAGLEELFSTAWEQVVAAFASGEALVELAGGD